MNIRISLENLQDEWNTAYNEIMETLYAEATPGVDYQEARKVERGEDEPRLYMQHFLPAERQDELIEEALEDTEIPEHLYFEAKKAVLLSHGPSTSLKGVDRVRDETGLGLESQDFARSWSENLRSQGFVEVAENGEVTLRRG